MSYCKVLSKINSNLELLLNQQSEIDHIISPYSVVCATDSSNTFSQSMYVREHYRFNNSTQVLTLVGKEYSIDGVNWSPTMPTDVNGDPYLTLNIGYCSTPSVNPITSVKLPLSGLTTTYGTIDHTLTKVLFAYIVDANGLIVPLIDIIINGTDITVNANVDMTGLFVVILGNI